MAKKPKKPTSDPRSPFDEFKPEKKEYYRQLPIPGLIYPLAKNNKKKRNVFSENNGNPV
jgi:hypothetical protein